MPYRNDEAQVCFDIEVRVPYAQAAAFAAAMTGSDDDVILAAEHAMRERIGGLGDRESVELRAVDWLPCGANPGEAARVLLDAARDPNDNDNPS